MKRPQHGHVFGYYFHRLVTFYARGFQRVLPRRGPQQLVFSKLIHRVCAQQSGHDMFI